MYRGITAIFFWIEVIKCEAALFAPAAFFEAGFHFKGRKLEGRFGFGFCSLLWEDCNSLAAFSELQCMGLRALY